MSPTSRHPANPLLIVPPPTTYGVFLGKARLALTLLLLLLATGSAGGVAFCQELAYEFRVGEHGVAKFAFVVGDEWVLSKPLMIGYTLSIKGNVSVIGVLRLAFKCGDLVGSSDHLLGLLRPNEKLSSLIAVRPTVSLLYCAEEGYAMLEPTLLLYEVGSGNGTSKLHSYQLSPLIIKLVKPVEPIHTSSCRVSIANDTALELCIETAQPWTPTSTARLLVSLRSTKALENVAIGVRADGWLLASRIVDLTTTTAHAWFFVEQKVLAALWREGEKLTLTAYANANKLSVEAPLETMLGKPGVNLLVNVEPPELVAGVPNTVEVRITNAWTKTVVVKGVELALNETKLWVKVGKKLPSLNSLTVKREVVVNKTGTVTLEVKVYYVAGIGISGHVERRVDIRIASPLKILSLEPSTIKANETAKAIALSLIGSSNATLLAYQAGSRKPIVLAKGLHLSKGTPTTLKFTARLKPGDYLVKLVDEHGYESNPLKLRVVKPAQAAEAELRIIVVPLQTSVAAGGVAEIRVVVSPPRTTTFKLYRLVGMPQPQWVLEHILEAVEESPGVYTVKYRAPSKPGTYTYKLVAKVNGAKKEARFTLEVEEQKRGSLQLGPLQEAMQARRLLPDWILLALIGVSMAGGLLLFRRYSRGA